MGRFDNMMKMAEETGVITPVDQGNDDDLPKVLVAPIGHTVPDDGLIKYVTVDSFKQLLDVQEGSAILFREDQENLLRVFAHDAALFGFNVKVLYGAPGSEYGRWFDEATFNLDKVSYSPFISEIRISRDVEAAKKANEPKTVVEKEEKQYRRSDGSVRFDDSIGVAGASSNDDADLD